MENNLYGLDCPYFTWTFRSIPELVDEAQKAGVDPSFEITKNGKPTGERMIDQMEM